MIKKVQARAYANIALCKYWGKMTGRGNLPATPSISLCLDKLVTDTIVMPSSKAPDQFFLDGKKANSSSFSRVSDYLKIWRQNNLIKKYFRIESVNSFPTGAGLASSASGYAALATALSVFSSRKISLQELSRLARMGSGSSARSITGGLSKLPVSNNPASQLILRAEDIPWGIVIAIVDAEKKDIGSTVGMNLSRKTSPFYQSWLEQSQKDYRAMLAAIRKMDFTQIGEICEANALAMHACMIATRPALIYWTAATVNLIKIASEMRANNLETYITIDAGPHVAFFANRQDMKKIKRKIAKVLGVKSVLMCYPAENAQIVEIS